MKISKDTIFKTTFTSVLEKTKNRKWTSRLVNFIANHKIISITFLIFILFFSVNVILIYNFIKLIQTI